MLKKRRRLRFIRNMSMIMVGFLMFVILPSPIHDGKIEVGQTKEVVQEVLTPQPTPAPQGDSQFQKNKKPLIAKPIQEPKKYNPKVIYLTFDDGPSIYTPAILKLLKQEKAYATFFMLEPNIRKYSNSVKQMIKDGHAAGLHGVTHNVKKFYASTKTVVGEMDKDNLALKQITGIETNLIRTPYGSSPYMTPAYRKAVKDHGYILWDWNVDSYDWKFKDARYVSASIKQVNHMHKLKREPVILLHEHKQTLASLKKLLDYFQKQGYIMKPLDDGIVPIQFP